MSFRSPTPDGLAVPPNAAAFGLNPAASNQELQSHHYWGRYALTTQLPNIGFLDGVAVAGANPAAVPAYDKLAPGDFGFVEGAAPPAVSNMYVCVDRGTVFSNDARWITLGNATFTQTIRDAHVIVVGQSTFLGALAAVATPPLAVNGLNLAGVGDVVGVTCDYLDPGNGSQLQFALAAALAGGIPIDIRLRPCDLALTAATAALYAPAGFPVPAFCRLIGAGKELSTLRGYTGGGATTENVVTLAGGATLEDVEIVSLAITANSTATFATLGLVHMTPSSGSVLRCRIQLDVTTAPLVNRVATAAISCPAGASAMLVDDCELRVDSFATQATPAPSYGVRIGSAGVTQMCDLDPEVRNTSLLPSTLTASAPHAVWIQNCEGGRVFNFDHVRAGGSATGLLAGVASFAWLWGVLGSTGLAPRGPRFVECRTDLSVVSEVCDEVGVTVILYGAADILGVTDTAIHDCFCRFTGSGNALFTKTAVKVINGLPTDVSLFQVTVTNCKSTFSRRGVVFDASGLLTVGGIKHSRITACSWLGPLAVGAESARGCILRGAAAAFTIRDVGIQNCDFTDSPAGGAGVEVDSAFVRNTIVLGNNLSPGAGTGLIDFGTGTEAGHNIVI
jgi:hypothetical protein